MSTSRPDYDVVCASMNTMPMPDAHIDESGRYIDEWGHPVDDTVCGETIDHDEVITYDGPDGIQWMCRRCDAEGFAEKEDPVTDDQHDLQG